MSILARIRQSEDGEGESSEGKWGGEERRGKGSEEEEVEREVNKEVKVEVERRGWGVEVKVGKCATLV